MNIVILKFYLLGVNNFDHPIHTKTVPDSEKAKKYYLKF